GGGSIEDLWAFNEEIVARAIYSSKIPVVSAIGHEVDFTIADFVADLRAPTPSAAAELIVPDRAELIDNIRNFCYTAKQFVSERLELEKQNIRSLLRSYAFNRPLDMLRTHSQHLDDLRKSLARSVSHQSTLTQERVRSLDLRLAALNPNSILRRGYSVVTRAGAMVSSAVSLHAGDNVNIRFHDGARDATVKE
ncbi:MAG TPA: exodeoxyribonuclease VII large subunit, partial [Bacteroidota bacterium]|nr:exodeoxyribonuclease VII large subunit [Bacteroidota bacterium]